MTGGWGWVVRGNQVGLIVSHPSTLHLALCPRRSTWALCFLLESAGEGMEVGGDQHRQEVGGGKIGKSRCFSPSVPPYILQPSACAWSQLPTTAHLGWCALPVCYPTLPTPLLQLPRHPF